MLLRLSTSQTCLRSTRYRVGTSYYWIRGQIYVIHVDQRLPVDQVSCRWVLPITTGMCSLMFLWCEELDIVGIICQIGKLSRTEDMVTLIPRYRTLLAAKAFQLLCRSPVAC